MRSLQKFIEDIQAENEEEVTSESCKILHWNEQNEIREQIDINSYYNQNSKVFPSSFSSVNVESLEEEFIYQEDEEENSNKSSSENKIGTQNEKQLESEFIQNQQRTCVVSIPCNKSLFAQRKYLLNGDVLIDFGGYKSFSRIGELNLFKKMSYVVRDKLLNQVYVEMESKEIGTNQFTDLAQYCLVQPNKTLHLLGEQLLVHQDRVNYLKKFAEFIQSSPLKDQFLDACLTCYSNFQQKYKTEAKKLIQNGTIKFYKTKTVKIDFSTGSYVLDNIGISEVLLALIGISYEQAIQFILRKGMFEFSFSLEEFSQEMNYLTMYKNTNVHFSFDNNLKTFDGIDIQCKSTFYIIHNTDNFISQKTGIDLHEFHLIMNYEITPAMLRQVIQMRNSPSLALSYHFLENEADWNYLEESKEFINTFYPLDRML